MKDKVSYQSNIKFVERFWTYSIEDVYKIVKDGGNWSIDLKWATQIIQNEMDHNKQNELKKQLLPYVCFNGQFLHRDNYHLKEYSNYTAIDFDGFSSESDLGRTGYLLTQTPFVKFAFRSPSGRGLKAIIEHNNEEPKYHEFLYKELLNYFNIPQLDPKTCDISRATFLCHDPYAWWNPNCKAYEFDVSKYKDQIDCDSYYPVSLDDFYQVMGNTVAKNHSFNDYKCPGKTNISDESIISIVKSWIKKDKDIKVGSRNNKLYDYSCLLCKAGVKYELSYNMLTDVFGNYGLAISEVNYTLSSAYSRYEKEFGTVRDSKFKKKKE